MLAIMVSVIAIASFFVGLILFFVFWSEDSQLEKYYKQTVENMQVSSSFFKTNIPFKTDIIIDSGHKYSKIRVVVRKVITKLRGYGVLDTIIIFNDNSNEQRALLILEAIKSALFNIELLDADFIEDLMKYHACRYASQSGNINKEVKFILRKKYEKTKYRDCINKLMDPNYSSQVVLNPPPEKRPLLEDLILPTVTSWGEALNDVEAAHAEKERFKSLFMDFSVGLSDKTWGILFIGLLSVDEYFSLFSSQIADFDSGVLLAARGSYIAKLLTLWERIKSNAQERWNIIFSPIDVIYDSKVHSKNRLLNCHLKFLVKEKIHKKD